MKVKAKTKKIILILLICLSAVLIFSGCKTKENPKIQVEMENGDIFIIELYPEYAPKTVANFIKLVEEGFFDDTVFHRIIPNFMAQGGGFDINGNAKESEWIDGEFDVNGYKKNTLKHTKGVISMARMDTSEWGDPKIGYNSASGGFFIVLETSPHLDGKYAAFGKVIEGMENVNKFKKVEIQKDARGELSQPVTPVILKKMTVIK